MQLESISEEHKVSLCSKSMLAPSARQHRLRLLAPHISQLTTQTSSSEGNALLSISFKSTPSLDQLLLAVSSINYWRPCRVISTGRDHTFYSAVFHTCSREQENKVQEQRSTFSSSSFQWLASGALAKSLDFSAYSSLCKQGEVILSHYYNI